MGFIERLRDRADRFVDEVSTCKSLDHNGHDGPCACTCGNCVCQGA